MLSLVVNAVVMLDVAEPLLLEVKVLLDVVLQHLELCGVIGVLGNGQNVCKEHVMLLVEPAVVNFEGFVPDVGLGDLVLQGSLVAKDGVLDVLLENMLL